MIYNVFEIRSLTKGSEFEEMVIQEPETNMVHIIIGFSYDLSRGYEDCIMVRDIIESPYYPSVILEPSKAYHYSKEGPKEINLRKFLLLIGSGYETEISDFVVRYSTDENDNIKLTQSCITTCD